MHKGFFFLLLCYGLLMIKYVYRLSEGAKKGDAVLQAAD